MLAEESWCWLAFGWDDEGVVTPIGCLLASVLQPLAGFRGIFGRAASRTHGWIDLIAYEYFARVVLLLCVICTRENGSALDTELQHLA